jgi:hypothetical protein
MAEGYTIEAWPEGRALQGCPSKNCKANAEFLTSFEYLWKRNGDPGYGKIVRRMARAACRRHAESFAEKHGLEMPVSTLPQSSEQNRPQSEDPRL